MYFLSLKYHFEKLCNVNDKNKQLLSIRCKYFMNNKKYNTLLLKKKISSSFEPNYLKTNSLS